MPLNDPNVNVEGYLQQGCTQNSVITVRLALFPVFSLGFTTFLCECLLFFVPFFENTYTPNSVGDEERNAYFLLVSSPFVENLPFGLGMAGCEQEEVGQIFVLSRHE